MRRNRGKRICIIGAGAAGLSMAYYLQDKGYRNITIFEKNSNFGGKCFAEIKYGQASGMGAIALTANYRNTIRLIKKFGLTMEPSPVNVLLDFNDGYQYPLRDLFRDMEKFRLLVSIVKYFFQLLLNRKMLRNPGFGKLDGEISMPFSEWLEKKGLSNLKEIFTIPVTCFGYGYLNEIPAAYALKYMNFVNFGTLLYLGLMDMIHVKPLWSKMLTNSIQSLMKELARGVPNLRCSVKIQKIERNVSNDTPVRITIKGDKKPHEFDFLVIAIPQELRDLSFLDITQDEKSVFSKVVHFNYYTVSCEVKDFSQNFFLQIINDRKLQLPPSGFPLMVSKVWGESDIALFYSYDDQETSEREIITKLKANVKAINRKIVQILHVKKWDYFPHFNNEDLRNGIYEKLESLQGENNTYYIGGLLNFETVEHVITYSRYISNKYF